MRDEEQQITHHFTNIQALNNAYMPFVRDGGIFIPTENEFHLGNLVSATITLPENQQTFVFTGEVIWITPKSTRRFIYVSLDQHAIHRQSSATCIKRSFSRKFLSCIV